jgi:hypothetical protein
MPNKLHVANAKSITDGAAADFLQRINSKLPIVLVSWADNFEMNEELYNLDKYILVDFTEMGWDYKWDEKRNHFNEKNGFGKFWDWVTNNTPSRTFVRELPKRFVTEYILPIEYPCRNIVPEIQTEEQFNSRPINVFFSWGLSNPIRPKLHGDIWSLMNDYGYIVGDNIMNLAKFLHEEKNPRKWVTVNVPHYARFDVRNIIEINGASKLSVSLWGAGRKCFRHTESPVNSIMVCQEDDFAWTHEWIHGVNCLKFANESMMVNELEAFLKRGDLYQIYCEGVETCRKYQMDNYISHLEKLINEVA